MDNGIVNDGREFALNNTTASSAESGILSLFSLKGKTAIISGAGAGIGLAIAQVYAEAGANVAIWYNSNKSAIDRANEIEEKYKVKCKAYPVNICDPEATTNAVNEVLNDFNGRLDIFVANSGIPWTKGPMVDTDLDHYHKVMKTDFDGTFYSAKAAAQVWKRQKAEGTDIHGNKLENFTSGSFIATASMSGHIVNVPQTQAAYNAAKAGVIHLCKSLAVEWVKFARANTISPGYILTEIANFLPKETLDMLSSKIPMGRQGQTHELSGAYLYLASNASSYTTGTDIIIDGGYTLT